MKNTVDRYLSRNADLHGRPLQGVIPGDVDLVVTIPALDEEHTLPKTLESLAANDDLTNTLVIVVVNNRAPSEIDELVIRANERTLAWLQSDAPDALQIAYVDASSSGKELAKKEGVGTARKLAMDHAVDVLRRSNAPSTVIVALDADTTVEPNYLSSIRRHFHNSDAWAAVIDFAHPIADGPEGRMILEYEFFLRYHVMGLRFARSPYAFHTIGSTMACTPDAYAAIGGMNRKQAAEDFYFLQQLAKTGPIDFINETTVHPSARESWRVPFGTGKHMQSTDADSELLVYAPETFDVIRDWLALVSSKIEDDAAAILTAAGMIHPELHEYLVSVRFEEQWPKLKANAPNAQALMAQFHRWFDALKTLKLTHHLRDHGVRQRGIRAALEATLPRWESGGNGQRSDKAPHDVSRAMLEHLRDTMKTYDGQAGLRKGK